jgi:hypothetical protein
MTAALTSSAIAGTGTDNSLLFFWQAVGKTDWHSEEVDGPGTIAWYTVPSVAQVGDSVVIAATGSDQSVLFYWQTIGTTDWYREIVDGPGTISAHHFSAPSVAQVGDSSVIAAQGADDSLMFYWQTIGTAPWNAEQVAGPVTSMGPPAVAQVGRSSVIASRATGAIALFFWQSIGTVPWHQEQVTGQRGANGPLSITQLCPT